VKKWIFLLLGLCSCAFADTSFSNMNFTPAAGDLSMNYLGLVFGTVPGSGLTGGTNNLIGGIFEVFNTGVLVMTMAIVGYTVFTTVVGVSQEGSGAFQTKISPWVTARITFGTSLLLPIPGSGYSGIQVMVMSCVVQGVGFANLIYDQVLVYVKDGGSVVSGKASPDQEIQSKLVENLEKFVDGYSDLFKVGACVYYRNQQFSTNTFSIVNSDNKGIVYVPNADGGNVKCGEVALGALGANTAETNAENAIAVANNIISLVKNQLNQDARSACGLGENLSETNCPNAANLAMAAQISVFQQEASGSSASALRSGWQSEAKKRGWITAASYYDKLINAKGADPNTSAPLYIRFGLSGPTVTVVAPDGDYKEPYGNYVGHVKDVKKAAKTQLKQQYEASEVVPADNSSAASAIANAIKSGLGPAAGSACFSDGPIDVSMTGLVPGGCVYFAFDHLVVLSNHVITKLTGCNLMDCVDGGGSFNSSGCKRVQKKRDSCPSDYAKNNGFLGMLDKDNNGLIFDPLNEMRTLGISMIAAATTYWKTTLDVMYEKTSKMAWATFGVRLAINLPLGVAQAALYGISPPGAAVVGTVQTTLNSMVDVFVQLTKSALEVYLPFGTALATIFFAQGVVLGIYLPFLPYILYIFGAIGWLMAAAEAMVAAPLVAMGVTHPEGHDLLGKAEQSLMLLLGIFVRPATMLIGFIFSINMATIAVGLLNRGFLNVLIDFLKSTSSNPVVISITVMGAMLVYTYVMMGVLDQAYSLIYQIPDRILRWIGGPADAPGAGAAQAAREIKQQTQSSGQQAGQGAGQAMKAPNIQVDSGAGQVDAQAAREGFANAQKDGQGGQVGQ